MEILLENASKPFLLNSYEQGFRNMYFTTTGCCRMYDITLSFHTPLSATGEDPRAATETSAARNK